MAQNGKTVKNGTKPVELDELDKGILRYLQNDGTASLHEIAKALGKSVSAVKNHHDRLVKDQVIKNTIAVVDCCKVGYREMLLLSIRVNTTVNLGEIFESLKNINTINAIYQVSGAFPVFCMAKCVEKEDQIMLLENIKAIKGIEEIHTEVALQRIKEDMRVAIPD